MKRLLKLTAMAGLFTLLRMAMGFVIAKVVAIYTGPTGMAMLVQEQNMVGSLKGIINAPAGSGVVRFTAGYKEQGFEACPFGSAPRCNRCFLFRRFQFRLVILSEADCLMMST
jgi:hypothetical protein